MDDKLSKNTSKKKPFDLRRIIFLCLTIIAFVIAGLNVGKPFHIPIPWTRGWVAPSACTDSHTGSTVVMDDLRARVSILNADGKLTGQIEGTVGGHRLYPGMAIHTNGQYVYIVNAVSSSNTSAITSEEILQFDMQGKYIATLATKKWADNDSRSTFSIGDFVLNKDNSLDAFIMDGDHIDCCTTNDKKELVTQSTISLPGKTVYRCNLSSQVDVLTIVTTSGDIYTCDMGSGGEPKCVYAYDGTHQFANAVVGTDGILYASNYNDKEIDTISAAGTPTLWASNVKTSFLTPGTGNIIVCDETTNTLQKIDTQTREAQKTAAVTYAPSYILRYAAVDLAYLWLIVCLALWLIRLLIQRRKKSRDAGPVKHSKGFSRGRAIAFMLISATIVICSFTVYYTGKERTHTINDLARAATLFSRNSNDGLGNDLAKINSPADLSSASDKAITKYLDNFWKTSVAYDFNSYYFLTRLEGDELIVTADSDGQYQPGTRYEKLSASNDGQSLLQGKTVTGKASDGWGTYDYAEAPVYDTQGTLVGVMEIGMYDETFNRTQVESTLTIIIMVLTMLTGAIILMGELEGVRKAFKQLKGASREERVLSLVRPMTFFFCLCTSLDTVYITIILKEMLAANGLGGNTFLHPVILTCVSIGNLVGVPLGTRLASRFRVKWILAGSFILLLVSAICMGTALMLNNLAFYVLLLFLFNTLYGLLFSLLRFLPTISPDTERRFGLFREIETTSVSADVLGVALGGYISQYFGYTVMYFIGAAICVIPIVISIFGLSSIKLVRKQEPGETKKETSFASSVRFFLSPRGVLPIVLSMTMVLVGTGYKLYLFPLYSKSLGYNLTVIANVIVIVSALPAVLETNINDLVATIGKKKAYTSTLFIMGIIMLFSVFNPNYIWAILFIGVSQTSVNICKPFENIFFLKRANDNDIPSTQSLSTNVTWGNFIRIVRPMIYDVLIMFGYSVASIVLTFAFVGSVMIFSTMTRKETGFEVTKEG